MKKVAVNTATLFLSMFNQYINITIMIKYIIIIYIYIYYAVSKFPIQTWAVILFLLSDDRTDRKK